MKIKVFVYCGEYGKKIVTANIKDLIPSLIAEDEDYDFEQFLRDYVKDYTDEFMYCLEHSEHPLADLKEIWENGLVSDLMQIVNRESRLYGLEDNFFSYELDVPCGCCEKALNADVNKVLQEIVDEVGLTTLLNKLGFPVG